MFIFKSREKASLVRENNNRNVVFIFGWTPWRVDSVSWKAKTSLNIFHSGCEWLTCLQQNFSPVQVLHFIAVVLRVSRAGPGAARLGPVDFSETFCMQLQRLHFSLHRELEHNLPWDNISAAEHWRTVQLRGIEHYVKLFQLVENHLWSCKSLQPLK